MRIDVANYQRTVGDELRRARKQHGWTRKELQERLNNEVSWQTLATYELGTRQCSVARFAELCAALDEQPYALLERVHQRLYPKDVPPDAVRITLGTIIDDDQPELLPLRR
ncbi:MAG: helix-turn-helix transcriptional regulator, partial [Sciscionella sp.]|nr:helix-turn-helix transcriptional regulator [Sciscionella sp.]